MTPTLTQSGLLAVLLERQRRKLIQSARPASRPPQARASRLLEYPHLAVPRAHGINHTYAELRQQIHDELRIQHPEWVEPNGESSMCLLELLDSLTRIRSTESVAAIRRPLEQSPGR
jgi:hypothetical protein